MSSDAPHQLTETYGLQEAALAGATHDQADEIHAALARAERLAARSDPEESGLHEQAVEDTAEQLAELSDKYGVDLAEYVPGFGEDAALQAALSRAKEDDEGKEMADLSETERAEKRELESRLADLEEKDSALADAERERIEGEIADLSAD